MRTGRALTVSGGGGLVHPRRNFWEKRFEKKKKKNLKKKKLEEPPPPKIWRHPPGKLETPWDQTPSRDQTPPGPDPPLTESQTRVKILPWPNFVAAGNYSIKL